MMITEIEDYFTKGCGRCKRFATPECSATLWGPGLQHLRRICRAAGLVETVKWGHPVYMHADRNIAILGAFRDNFRISFFKAALLSDPDGVLEYQGPNTQNPSIIRFRDNTLSVGAEPVILDFLGQLKAAAEAGTVPAKVIRTLEMPEELVEALDADPELAEAFHALTPGRQKSYLFNLSTAKQSATRSARIVKFRDKIIAGKGAMDR